MGPRCKILVWLSFVVVMFMVSGAAPAFADSVMPENKVPGAVESTARRLTNGLRQQGYQVARGYFKLYTNDDCGRSFEVMHTCYGNNPAAPYVLPVLPYWPDEWADPATVGAVGETAEDYSASYRLGAREAIVILGVLPPRADYFGLQTYLFTRPGTWNPESDQYKWFAKYSPYMLETFFGKVPGNQDRIQLFANLSNSINNVVIQDKSDAVWNQLRFFVITPDRTMDSAVRKALAKVGIADKTIFTEPIPSDMRIGLNAAADDFLTVIRYSMPADGGDEGSPSYAWRDRLPLVVLRIRDTRTTNLGQTYPPVVFEPRTGTEPPEIALEPDLITLAKAICARWGQDCNLADPVAFKARVRPFLNMQAAPFFLRGPECMKIGMNCLAPTEDTTYFLSGKLPLDDKRVYAVIGALSTATRNATYVGLGLNSSLKKQAFENIADEDLVGSANKYLEVPNHDKFFVQYFARDCFGLEALTGDENGDRCFSIGDLLPACTDPADLTCDMLVLSLRDYLRPGTQRGSKPELTLTPRFIPLQRP